VSSGWGQTSPNDSGGWGQPNQQKITGSGWGEPSNAKPPTPGWNQPSADPKNASMRGWGQPTSGSKVTPPSSVSSISPSWVSSSQGKSQWSSNATNGPQWSTQPTATSQPNAIQNPSTGALWNSASQPITNSQAPRPIGSQQSSQPQVPNPTQQRTIDQPSSFAAVAGKNLPPAPPQIQPAFRARQTREDLITRAVNSSEGWGKTPVRQDTDWDLDDSPKMQRKVMPAVSGTPGQDPGNTWNQPNDGTAIWETAKEPVAAAKPNWTEQPPQQLGPQSHLHWGNPDADAGTWDGPPDTNNYQSTQRTSQPAPPAPVTGQWAQPVPQPPRNDNMWNDETSKAGMIF
jgi:hypothetical protein